MGPHTGVSGVRPLCVVWLHHISNVPTFDKVPTLIYKIEFRERFVWALGRLSTSARRACTVEYDGNARRSLESCVYAFRPMRGNSCTMVPETNDHKSTIEGYVTTSVDWVLNKWI